jgi:hypothetical protein
MTQCRHCGAEIEATFRFCPWCSGAQRSKLVEFFRGVDEDEHRMLRVSRYLPEKRVRLSVWDETGTARAAVSLDDDGAARLAAFLAPPPERARPSLLDELRTLVRR